jgi:hypothetical protein
VKSVTSAIASRSTETPRRRGSSRSGCGQLLSREAGFRVGFGPRGGVPRLGAIEDEQQAAGGAEASSDRSDEASRQTVSCSVVPWMALDGVDEAQPSRLASSISDRPQPSP